MCMLIHIYVSISILFYIYFIWYKYVFTVVSSSHPCVLLSLTLFLSLFYFMFNSGYYLFIGSIIAQRTWIWIESEWERERKVPLKIGCYNVILMLFFYALPYLNLCWNHENNIITTLIKKKKTNICRVGGRWTQ